MNDVDVGVVALLAAEWRDNWSGARWLAATLGAIIYVDGLVFTAFSASGRRSWRGWWQKYAPLVVAKMDRAGHAPR